MKAQYVIYISFVIAWINASEKCLPLTHQSLESELLKHYSKIYQDGYSIKRTAGTFALARKRHNHKDMILIKSLHGDIDLSDSQKKTHLYTGGLGGFAWKAQNQIHVFNIDNNKHSKLFFEETYKIFDVLVMKNKAYIYCFDHHKNELLIRFNLKDSSSKVHLFNGKADSRLLDDGFVRFLTTDSNYALIEGLPKFSPSLLVENFAKRQTIGVFKSKYSDKHIAVSHNMRKYALHNKKIFMLHDYEAQKDIIHTIDSTFLNDELIEKIMFATTDDVLLVQAETKMVIISFEEDKHWNVSFSKPIKNLLPHKELEKTLILTQDNIFGYLAYNHSLDRFEMINIL